MSVVHEHGILFVAAMVRAILAGTKTQTRRLITPRSTWFNGDTWAKWEKEATWDWDKAWVDGGPSPAGNPGPYLHLPFLAHPDPEVSRWWVGTSHRIYPRVQPGDRLWVRETWRTSGYSGRNLHTDNPIHEVFLDYAAGGGRTVRRSEAEYGGRLRADGQVAWRPSIYMPRWASRITLPVVRMRVERLQAITTADAWAEGISPEAIHQEPRQGFAALWDSINAKRAPFDSNPWVLVYEWEPFHG